MVKTFKHRKNTNNKTRSKKNFNKISITVDFTKKDKGYNDMLNSRLLKFIIENVKKGNNLIQTPAPRRWFNAATGYGALGFSPPAAIGAQIADPKSQVICLVGDGGFQFP